MVMQGLTIQSLRKHKALVPLLVIVGGGVVFSSVYLARLAIKCPDASWARGKNPEPWQEYEKKQYKFYSPTIDYSKLKSERPTF